MGLPCHSEVFIQTIKERVNYYHDADTCLTELGEVCSNFTKIPAQFETIRKDEYVRYCLLGDGLMAMMLVQPTHERFKKNRQPEILIW